MLKIKNNGKLPSHIWVGAAKAASSWVWKNLSLHPDVFTSDKKEIHFFDNNYQKGIDWYQGNFITDKKVVLDVTPNYLNEECLTLIKKHIPYVSIMMCFRNPIYRAFSQWKFHRFLTGSNIPFLNFWNKNEVVVQNHGLYYEHLKCCKTKFNQEKIYYCFYDDIKKNPDKFLNEIYDYLQIKANKSEFSNCRWMPGKESCWTKTGIQHDNVKERYKYYTKFFEKLFLSYEEWKFLKNFYKESIVNLQNLTGRDLSLWLEFKQEEE